MPRNRVIHMPTLSFEGETHQEIVSKVKKWLASQAGDERLSPTDAVAATADITKEALRVIAAAAPEPIAQNELVKALTGMGYKATDATRDAMIQSLNALSTVTGGGMVAPAHMPVEEALLARFGEVFTVKHVVELDSVAEFDATDPLSER